MKQLILSALLTTSGPLAAWAEAFGDAGTVVPRGGVQASQEYLEGGIYSYAAVDPELAYFVSDRLSVGAGLQVGGGSFQNSVFWMLGVKLTAGYYLPLNETWGLYPELSAAVRDSGASGAAIGGRAAVSLAATIPLLLHSGHFFLGAGPEVRRSFVLGSDSTGSMAIGLTSVIGGWF